MPIIETTAQISKRKRNQEGYKRVNHDDRISIIYDNQNHNMSVQELIEKYQVNYNTIRHIIA